MNGRCGIFVLFEYVHGRFGAGQLQDIIGGSILLLTTTYGMHIVQVRFLFFILVVFKIQCGSHLNSHFRKYHNCLVCDITLVAYCTFFTYLPKVFLHIFCPMSVEM